MMSGEQRDHGMDALELRGLTDLLRLVRFST